MFRIDPAFHSINRNAGQVIDIVSSLNEIAVAIPEVATETCRAAAAGLCMPDGRFTVYIALFLTGTQRQVIYVPDPGSVPPERYAELFDDAHTFLESMGFMLDNVNFRSLSADRQSELLSELPAFSVPGNIEQDAFEELEPSEDLGSAPEPEPELALVEADAVASAQRPSSDDLARLARVLAAF